MDNNTCFFEGAWHWGRVPLMDSMSQASWLASMVFDGARAFGGFVPDLDRHCARVVRSARAMGLNPQITASEIEDLAREGVARFPKGTELYIRPMFWADGGMVLFDPATTKFALVLHVEPMPPPDRTFTACLSRYRRPSPESAPTFAKAGALYPLSGMAQRDAVARGFNKAVMLDAVGNVAEFQDSNLFMVKDGIAVTPVPNNTFLAGITRQRVIGLLSDAGIPVEERTVRPQELDEADEIFACGNYSKVMPATGYEGRVLQPGPIARQAHALYMDFAAGHLV